MSTPLPLSSLAALGRTQLTCCAHVCGHTPTVLQAFASDRCATMPRPPASNTVADTVLTSASLLAIAYCIYRFMSPSVTHIARSSNQTALASTKTTSVASSTHTSNGSSATADSYNTPTKATRPTNGVYEASEVKSMDDSGSYDEMGSPQSFSSTSSSVHLSRSPLSQSATLTASAEKDSRRSAYIPPTPLTGGQGKAALFVAAGRAAHCQQSSQPLFDDPYAAQLSGDYGQQMLSAIAAESGEGREKLIAHIAVRTRCFDEQLMAAVTTPRSTQQHYVSPQKSGSTIATDTEADVTRQVVLLGVGSDTRSLRLALPEYVTVWELDTAEVLTFREERLTAAITSAGGEDALPSKARTIPLEYDVTSVSAATGNALLPLLASHGFDSTKPSVFVLEHCLRFLRDSQVRLLLSALASLCTSHSLLLCDTVNQQYFKHQSMAELLATWERWSLRPLCGYDLPEAVWLQCGWAAQVLQYGQRVGGVDADYGLIGEEEKEYYLRDNLRGSTNDWPREWVIVARKS